MSILDGPGEPAPSVDGVVLLQEGGQLGADLWASRRDRGETGWALAA